MKTDKDYEGLTLYCIGAEKLGFVKKLQVNMMLVPMSRRGQGNVAKQHTLTKKS